MGKIRNILYKQKRKIYKFPKKFFQNTLWEKNIDNLYYGHYYILKKYSKTILPYKINGELQHGWSPNHGIPSNPLLETKNNKKKGITYSMKIIIKNVLNTDIIMLKLLVHHLFIFLIFLKKIKTNLQKV